MNVVNQDVNLVNVQFDEQPHIIASNISKHKPKFSKIVRQHLNYDQNIQDNEDFSNIIQIKYNQVQTDSHPSTQRYKRQPSYIDYVKKFYQHTKSRTFIRDIGKIQIDTKSEQQQEYYDLNYTKPCDVYFKPDPSRIKKREILNIIDENANLCHAQYNKQHMMQLAAVEKQKHANLFKFM